MRLGVENTAEERRHDRRGEASRLCYAVASEHPSGVFRLWVGRHAVVDLLDKT